MQWLEWWWLLLLLPIVLWGAFGAKRRIDALILALLVIALSRPAVPLSNDTEKIEARDYIIAIDLSASMHAQDIAPDRYRFALRAITQLLHEAPNDNVMLVAFTTNALLLSPPTTDSAIVSDALYALNPDYILTKGTSLEALFKRLEAWGQTGKEVVIFSDGGDEAEASEIIRTIEASEIVPIFVLTATDAGAPVPAKEGQWLHDKAGALVISRKNPIVQRIASATGGSVIEATTPEETAHAVLRTLDAASKLLDKRTHRYKELYFLPLLLSALLFAFRYTRLVRALIALPLIGAAAHGGVLDGYYLNKAFQACRSNAYKVCIERLEKIDKPSFESRWLRADAYYRTHDYAQARKLYLSLHSSDAQSKAKLYYNIANCYAKEGRFDEAAQFYKMALRIVDDPDARYNLRIVERLAKKRKPPAARSKATTRKKQNKRHRSGEAKGGKKSASGSRAQAQGSATQAKRAQAGTNERVQKYGVKHGKHPLSSKVYELINKGYIYEKKPW